MSAAEDPALIPLFPLSAVLFPSGRMALQVFEPRYLDMVSERLRAGLEFGVVLLTGGSEVYRARAWRPPSMAVLGCSARIVDWAALPHGRLGLTIEGGRRFRISSTSASPAHLQMARVQWLPPEEPLALTSANAHLGALLRSLVRHPEMARLGWHIDDADGLRVVNQLAQLLPMPSARRQQLLELPDPVTRLAAIEALIEALS